MPRTPFADNYFLYAGLGACAILFIPLFLVTVPLMLPFAVLGWLVDRARNYFDGDPPRGE